MIYKSLAILLCISQMVTWKQVLKNLIHSLHTSGRLMTLFCTCFVLSSDKLPPSCMIDKFLAILLYIFQMVRWEQALQAQAHFIHISDRLMTHFCVCLCGHVFRFYVSHLLSDSINKSGENFSPSCHSTLFIVMGAGIQKVNPVPWL